MMLMNRFIIGNVVRRTSKHIVIKSKFFSTKNQNKTVGIWGACFDQVEKNLIRINNLMTMKVKYRPSLIRVRGIQELVRVRDVEGVSFN